MKFPRATRKFLGAYLILHLIAAALFAFMLSGLVRKVMHGDAQQKMESMAAMLALQLENEGDDSSAASLMDQLAETAKKTGLRFSVVQKDGSVVVESLGASGDAVEVEPALLSWAKTGSSDGVFRSAESESRAYVARSIRVNDEAGFVRVGIDPASINNTVTSVQRYVWIFAIALGLLASALMLILSSSFIRPLELFSGAAERVGEGEYESVPAVRHRDDEWGDLGDAFEKMQKKLQKRESRLVENSQRLEAVLSSMIEGVLAVEPNGQVMLANGAACRMLSFHREKLVGRKLVEVVRIPELSNAIEKSQQERTFSKTEFKTLGDTNRTLKARVSMLADEDEPGVAVVLHDVTELRQLETMRQDFVANVSHELKTPLASIKAYAETLRMGALKDENKNMQFLEQIEFQADTLNQQIQDLLQLARVESGEKTFSISDIDINMICESLHRQFLDSALGRHLELHLQLAQPTPFARCDADAVETVVKNLIVNAIHYTPEGGRVSIATSVDDQWVVISVVDTGIGISPEQQTRVFERFYRVDKARSRDMGGTGLGLAIVKHLTQSFGGTVTLESQLGKGSKFHVRLPKSKA